MHPRASRSIMTQAWFPDLRRRMSTYSMARCAPTMSLPDIWPTAYECAVRAFSVSGAPFTAGAALDENGRRFSRPDGHGQDEPLAVPVFAANGNHHQSGEQERPGAR